MKMGTMRHTGDVDLAKEPGLGMPATRGERAVRVLFLLALFGVLAWFAMRTWRWPLIQDSAVMHYVLFLMHHGFQPYREITDNNLPGAYLLERAAILLFGPTDLGWRIYDLALSVVLTGCLVVISWPYDWLAGVFAGGLFALRHGTDGIWFVAEREQEMAVLLAAAVMFQFLGERKRWPSLTLLFGFLAGIAASIKPTLAPFLLVALALQFVHRRRLGVPTLPPLLWGLGGAALALLANVLFLERYHALSAFLQVTRLVTPVYASLNNPGRRQLLVSAIPHDMLPFVLLVPAIAFVRRAEWTWERLVLLTACGFGMLSYLLQRKGFPYHRYIFLVFGLELAGLALLPRMRERGSLRWVGFAGLLYAALVILPRDVAVIRKLPNESPMQQAMQADLVRLGGARLQGQVQCFDLILGCLDSLYQLRLVENKPFTGDMLLFSKHPNPATSYYEQIYDRLDREHPANVLVVTNEEFGGPVSFRRLAWWPAFQQNLAKDYSLILTRSFPREGRRTTDASPPPDETLAYRIYLRHGVSLPGSQPAHEGAAP